MRVKALVAQSCLTRCNPMDYSLPKLLCPWNFPDKHTGVGGYFLLQYICLLPLKPPSHPPPHLIPSLWVVTENQAELPVLYASFPLSVLYMVMYVLECYSFHLPHPLLSPLCPQVSSLCLCLYSCPANRFIDTIF